MKKSIFAALFYSFISMPGFAQQPGMLDLSFNTTGSVSTSINILDIALSVVIQPDNKILVAGVTSIGSSTEHAIAIIRYQPNGSLDFMFGTNGKVLTPIKYEGTAGEHLLSLQTDGKIIVCGYTDSLLVADFALVRYNPDGTIDPGFGTNGIAMVDISAQRDVAFAHAIQSDHKIIAGGITTSLQSYYNLALVRFNPDGSLDSSFANHGIATTVISPQNDFIYTLALQQDGKILAAGISDNGSSLVSVLLRYNVDGSIDSTFGTNGFAANASSPFSILHSIAVQSDQKILVAGFNLVNGLELHIYRYQPDGSPDASFGTNGLVVYTANALYSGDGTLISQPDGKILVAASVYNNGKYAFSLFRLNTNGSLDNTFGVGGVTGTTVGTSSQTKALTLDQQGRAVVVGNTVGAGLDFALARFFATDSIVMVHDPNVLEIIAVHPNPVHETAQISYRLAEPGMISLNITDARGRLVQRIINREIRPSGDHTDILPGKDLPAGMYFVNLLTEHATTAFRIIKL